MVHAHERPVDPDLLGGDGELDRLAERIATGVREAAGRMPGTERKRKPIFFFSCGPPHLLVTGKSSGSGMLTGPFLHERVWVDEPEAAGRVRLTAARVAPGSNLCEPVKAAANGARAEAAPRPGRGRYGAPGRLHREVGSIIWGEPNVRIPERLDLAPGKTRRLS